MNEIQVGKLFDRFFTVEAARNLGGLGLAISKTLVEQMGGNMMFRHAEPAQFIFRLQGGRRRFSGTILEITREVLEEMCVLREEEEK